ncbi:MAG: translocase [Planctomycetaceae bacterium]|nr:translocase [Planctomycetaceae bacterium]
MSLLTKIAVVGPWRLAGWRRRVAQVHAWGGSVREMSDARLRKRARELRWEAKGGASLAKLLPELYALAIEATDRELGLRHFPVQVLGAVALFHNHIAEMQTGEGKTITGVLPVALRALVGRGVHVVTANEYLAGRDAEKLGPIFKRLDLTAGCVRAKMTDDDRRAAYAQDVTYGTASEMGFDFLRDRLKAGAELRDAPRRLMFQDAEGGGPVQRGHYFCLIDEADSILIDEARTPLIIGMEQPNKPSAIRLYRWSQRAVEQLRPTADFNFEPRRRQAHLTEAGARKVSLLAKPAALDVYDIERIYQHVEQSLAASYGFACDRDYVVVDGEVAIVDEGTGRIMEGRKWQAGLHQAVEAKESVAVTPVTVSAAQITIQSLYRRYEHLCGMTGTAAQTARELRKTYRCRVAVIPTHRPCIRRGLPSRVFMSQQAKRVAIAADVLRLVAAERSVLIGTPSVSASEALSALFQQQGIEHVVLNARFLEEEAEIVAQAGQPGRVTIATNMAGRGTDILLDDRVRRAGGLHVVATEMHTSARIDRQLVGRAARQGDPGSFQYMLSLEDELLRVLSQRQQQNLRAREQPDAGGELPAGLLKVFRRTQRQLERLHAKQRRQLLKHQGERQKRYQRMGLDPHLELVEN